MCVLQVDLPVKFSNGEAVLVTFRGDGIVDMGEEGTETSKPGNIPQTSSIALSEQVSTMSTCFVHRTFHTIIM